METTDKNPSKEDILKTAQESVLQFADSFGPDDIYREILLEELFKILLLKNTKMKGK